MQKIEFKNKGEEGYENSKINASNLNQIQENTENEINNIKENYVIGNLKELVKQVNISTINIWYDTGITGGDLESGTYIMELYLTSSSVNDQYQERISGILAWRNESTNSNDADEVPVSKAGHARNGHNIKLRILRTRSGETTPNRIKLQISDTVAWKGIGTLTFKFRKII